VATISATTKATIESWLGAGSGTAPVDFVLEVAPILVSTSTVTTLYFSAYGYRNAPKDSPARFELPSSLSVSVINDTLGRERGEGVVDLDQFKPGQINSGTFRLLNADHELDTLKTLYSWGDAEAKIMVGFKNEAYANYEAVWTFFVERDPVASFPYLEFGTKSAVFNVNLPAQSDLFAGSGGLEGGSSLKGKPKPKTFGEVYSVQGARVGGTASPQYLFDPDGVNSIDKGYEGGHPDTTLHGGYSENLGAGHATLGAEPQGDATFDVKGQKFDGGSYSDLQGKIADEILTSEGLTGFSAGDISDFATDTGSPNAGIHLSHEREWRIGEALQWILGKRATFFPDQDGAAPRMVVVKEPSGETASETYAGKSAGQRAEDGAHIKSIRMVPLSPPAYHVSLGFQELWKRPGQLFTEDASEIDRQSEPRQYATATDATVQTDYPNAVRLFAPSPLADSTEAGTEASNLLTLFKVPRVLLEVDLCRKFFHSWIGDYVTVKFDRYGLDSGQNFLVVGFRASLNPTSRRFTMLCWGAEP